MLKMNFRTPKTQIGNYIFLIPTAPLKKSNFLLFYLFLFIAQNAIATTYTTISNGNWLSNSTWQNGNRPDPEDIGNNDIVNIYHDITLQGKELKIDGNSSTLVLVSGGSINANLSNNLKGMKIEKGTFKAINSEVVFEFGKYGIFPREIK